MAVDALSLVCLFVVRLYHVSPSDLVVCGDVQGNMWFIQPPELSTWNKRKLVSIERKYL